MSVGADFGGVFGDAIFADVVFADLNALGTVPPVPPVTAGGIHGGAGFYPVRIDRLLDRLAEQGLAALGDDEVAVLMMLGLL